MILNRRIDLLLCLPLSSLDRLAIKKEIDGIGQQCDNPPVTPSRSGISGHRISCFVPLFVAAQLAGGIAATLLFRWLIPNLPSTATDVVIPRSSTNNT
ncbi:MAG TPA: hypothetical protein VOA64_13365 [Candidatus Dormibacteraeota bacterium]|nr:hypothetical protein [Candidatus Dormibacteraeota bacterium]